LRKPYPELLYLVFKFLSDYIFGNNSFPSSIAWSDDLILKSQVVPFSTPQQLIFRFSQFNVYFHDLMAILLQSSPVVKRFVLSKGSF